MKKIILLALILIVVSAGVVFAQDYDDDFSYMPKNTITVDIGPTVAGLIFGGTSDIIGGIGKIFGLSMDMGGFETSGFGIGVQYERLLIEKLSVAGRFAYMTMGTGLVLGDFGGTKIDITSFSIEAHIKYFIDETTFIEGMLGYANMTAKFGYEYLDVSNASLTGGVPKKKEGFEVPRDYFKYGLKFGWRYDFGEPGGLIFEPSLGWSFGISKSPTIVQKAADALLGEGQGKKMDPITRNTLEGFTWGIDNLVFVGGPRLSLAIGWSF